ncbi:unnamed protein product [Phytophthora lilii]|uniref:Unnamed protein product n=1 Tax=Phytophthora lilii TaxID=2077276 RepID=A0A9W7CTE5_9STRA|nr:unnamed protein product [Phytophthora lilii]
MSETQLSDQYLFQSSLKSDPEIKVSSGKCVPFVIDLNQGSYQNGVITIDATSQLYGSEGFACLRDAYIMLPYNVSMKNTHATNVQNAANQFCAGLKCGNFNVIDSMSLELNGKTIVSMADYKLFWNNIRAQTRYSPQYVEKHIVESFLYPDAAQSTKYSSATATTGDGYLNHTAISTTFTAGTISATASVANDGFTKRLLSNPPNAGADPSTSWPSTGAASATTIIANQLGRGVQPTAIIFKPVKKVRYNDCYAQWFYQRAGIGKQSTQLNASFDLQLSTSVTNAKYVILLPFAEQTGSFASAAVQEFQSPFDSAPWTLHPGSSIRNFNVRIGSQQTFDISHDYDFHHFTNEIAKIASINDDITPELGNSLLDYQTWSLPNRVLIADVSRLTERDVPQAIQVQGVNAGCQGTNMFVLVVSEQELSYDRLTGEVLDFTTT